MSLYRIDPARRELALELLADRAIFGLDGESSLELDRLLLECPDVDENSLDLAAAAIEVLATAAGPRGGALSREQSAISATIPTALRARLIGSGEAWVRTHVAAAMPGRLEAHTEPGAGRSFSSAQGNGTATPRPRRDAAAATAVARKIAPSWSLAAVGWIAAAAAVVLAVSAWWPRLATARTPAGARAALIASAPDLVRSDWTTPGHELVDDFLCGDIVWSEDLQQGYMTITGLRANDPTKSQYQLWIFDATRDDAHPVDGGVFDVPSSDKIDMVVVPFTPRLKVRDATLFAVTVEPPGGVVVSKRDIALLASASTDG